MKSARGKRAHLLALWSPRAEAQDRREHDRVTAATWRRYIEKCAHAQRIVRRPRGMILAD